MNFQESHRPQRFPLMVGQFEGFQFDYAWIIYLGGRRVKGGVYNWNFNHQSWHKVIIMRVSDAVALLVCISQTRDQFYMMSAKLQNDLGHLILRLVSEPEQGFKLTVSVCLSSSVFISTWAKVSNIGNFFFFFFFFI